MAFVTFTGWGLRRLFSTSPIPAFTWTRQFGTVFPGVSIYNMREGESVSCCLSLFCIYVFFNLFCVGSPKPHTHLYCKDLISLDCVSLL